MDFDLNVLPKEWDLEVEVVLYPVYLSSEWSNIGEIILCNKKIFDILTVKEDIITDVTRIQICGEGYLCFVLHALIFSAPERRIFSMQEYKLNYFSFLI